MDLKDKTIIVFGASSGIGEALARQLSADNRVGTFSRRALPNSNSKCLHVQGDVTQIDDIRKAMDVYKNKWAVIDGFIYCVGQAQITDFKTFKAADAKKIMDANFFGFLNCIECILPDLVKNKSGLIGVISALIVNRSLPNGATYFATKAAQHVFFEGLRLDLENEGLQFCEIRPGLVDTPMSRTVEIKTKKMWSADKAANHILESIKKNETDISFPLDLKLLTQSLTVLPDKTYFKLIKSQIETLKKGTF